MNTNNIKSFAKQARLILLDGVEQRLKFWGFNDDGYNDQSLESTHGGYIFRGQIYTDTSGAVKWNKLKKRLKDKQAVKDVKEEAAYTWFNRLMAIKILEANGYLPEQIGYAEGIRIPMVVQNAKRGHHSLSGKSDKSLLVEYLQEDKEEQAFGLLITDLCNRNKLLHDIFGRIDDYTEILLPQNLLQPGGLLDLINSDAIPTDDFKEVELIGWLYQFYIADKKDEVFAGFKLNKKARAEDIPAATQIFTPKWIVKYMVENTVGKIYLDYEPESQLKSQMKYLVESTINDQGLLVNETPLTINHSPLTISNLTELSLIDPASGSGHILVTGFELLFKMYREQGYTARQAVENILTHNLVGLDIDDRAMQLARFAVLLKAAAFDAEILEKGLMPRIYSFPETVHFTNEEIQTFLGYDGNTYVADLKETLILLNQGKNIGSALKIDLSSEALNCMNDQYANWLQKEKTAGLSLGELAIWNRLKPFLDVLLVLCQQYTAVVANPPYMGQKGMNDELKAYLFKNYPNSYGDLATVFMDVAFDHIFVNGIYSMINQASWLLKPSYKDLRESILDCSKTNLHIDSLMYLGPGVFEEIKGEVVQSVCFSIKKAKQTTSILFKLNQYKSSLQKRDAFVNQESKAFKKNISEFEDFSGKQFGFWLKTELLENFESSPIQKYGDARQGIKTGDNPYFIKNWHEISIRKFESKWFPVEKGGDFRKWYGNGDFVLNWENNGYEIKNFKNEKGKLRSRPQNLNFFFKEGITWSTSAGKNPSFRYSSNRLVFESSGSKFFVLTQDYDLLDFIAFFNSKVTGYIIEVFAPGIGFSEGSIKALPFLDLPVQNIGEIRSQAKEAISINKYDWDTHETSWDFEKSALLNEGNNLKQAYQIWQEQVTKDFFQLHANEEELNRIFIDIYGLQDELTPEVALKDITILQDELDRNALEQLETVFREHGKDAIALPIRKDEVISQFISYCIGVLMGRYRLDRPGLNIAHPNPTDEETASYTLTIHNSQLTINIDEDGILPLMGENCAFPDDALAQVKELMLAVWGEKNLIGNINFVHECLGGTDLHKWLTEKFWGYHTGMYKKKPIYWLFSSNPGKPQNAAFKVLVYMHRMDKYTVQNIQRHYLHPHQEYIRNEKDKLKENEDSLNKQELKRLEMLLNWELECRDYNEVLKELSLKPFVFDLDDGVDVNYLKFKGAVAVI